MRSPSRATHQASASGGFFGILWRYKFWWLLPLLVLLLLLGIIYALGHLSRTDSEMYPTSSVRTAAQVRES
jgi:uncharacterized membrane protein